MDIDLIERLIGLVERSRLIELDYAAGGITVRISRDPHGAAPRATVQPQVPVEGSVERDEAGPPVRPTQRPAAAHHIVAAGMIGTFFRSPGPGQPPFASEGDAIEEGQTLGILEAMKTLNPIEADRSGRLLRVLAEDGVSVVAGTPLFAIARTDRA